MHLFALILITILLCLNTSDIITKAETEILLDAEEEEYRVLTYSETNSVSSSSIKDISFEYTDVRNPSQILNFNGGDNKCRVIVYSSVARCSFAIWDLEDLERLVPYIDMNQIEIIVFDDFDNSYTNFDVEGFAKRYSKDVKFCKKTEADALLYEKCLQEVYKNNSWCSSNFFVAYIDKNGNIVNASSNADEALFEENIEALGVDVNIESSYQLLNITGTVDYEAAFELLNLVNETRVENGLNKLTMDSEYLESAMQLAAEYSLYYGPSGHRRPNNRDFTSINTKLNMYNQVTACGYDNEKEVMDYWLEYSPFIASLNDDIKCVGIGAFYINGTYYWCMLSGTDSPNSVSQFNNTIRTYNIQADKFNVKPYLEQDVYNLQNIGDTIQFEIWANNKVEYITTDKKVRIEADSYIWESDNPNIEVSEDGKVTAKGWGTANITAVNKNNSDYKIIGTVNVCTDAKISDTGIFVLENNQKNIIAGMAYGIDKEADVEFSWYASKDGSTWNSIQGWKKNDEWIRWSPNSFGDYKLKCIARVLGNSSSIAEEVVDVSFHPYIKGKCQMPYYMVAPDQPGYLIGVESYTNPNQSYQYEMLILDCTLLAQGLPAWTYTTGKFKVSEGNAGWCVWNPEYGYYWTLFRVYDADGNLIDEICYGFENIY